MKNKYLNELSKIEFVVTNACTGRCKHCFEGDHKLCAEHMDPQTAADAIRKVASVYDIKTVMAFGGEPLLYPETVYAIISAATELGIERRQIITNGFFSNDKKAVAEVARRLSECGVNDLLLSVDAFHQETIPLEAVIQFAKDAKAYGIPIRLQPAWLVSKTDNNPYNVRTRKILNSFTVLGIMESDGNIIYPEGNALIYLKEYFLDQRPENPYTEDPCQVKCLSFCPNGDVLGGNVYHDDVMNILENYTPQKGDHYDRQNS